MKYCIACNAVAKFTVQWGPAADQKEYSCEEHILSLIERVSAVDFFVTKIEKVNKKKEPTYL